MSAEDVIKCEERYGKSKTVHSIMRHVAEKCEVEMDLVNEMVAWPLYKKYGHAYEAFKLSISYVCFRFCRLPRPDCFARPPASPNQSLANSRSPPTSSPNSAPTLRAALPPNPSRSAPISRSPTSPSPASSRSKPPSPQERLSRPPTSLSRSG